MQFTSFLQDGRLTVALTGEIDHHCAKSYISGIAAKIEALHLLCVFWILRKSPLWIHPELRL